ncbi:hypothetical protein BJ165DRAFT_955 [Panaeolus papilionaceus]|nr:hypothetical protein BJ165DRAFT_955 [Panaeolus papilionaceus]
MCSFCSLLKWLSYSNALVDLGFNVHQDAKKGCHIRVTLLGLPESLVWLNDMDSTKIAESSSSQIHWTRSSFPVTPTFKLSRRSDPKDGSFLHSFQKSGRCNNRLLSSSLSTRHSIASLHEAHIRHTRPSAASGQPSRIKVKWNLPFSKSLRSTQTSRSSRSLPAALFSAPQGLTDQGLFHDSCSP